MAAIRKLRAVNGPAITLINTVDSSSIPLSFEFINESVLREGVYKAPRETVLGCSECRPQMGQGVGCEYTQRCHCLEYAPVNTATLNPIQQAKFDAGEYDGLPRRFPYYSPNSARSGLLINFYLEKRHPIYECNEGCPCGPVCKTRVVQKGRQIPLQIFKTKDRGWGLKSTVDLRQGQFIDTYRGEILTDEETGRREEAAGPGKDSYLYALDKFPESLPQGEEFFVVDGEYMGGPSRFMNHCCDPNCKQYTVSYNKNDNRVYEIAFFACRDIPKGEELTFDYLDKDYEDEAEIEGASDQKQADGDNYISCRCGAERCRGKLWV